jgi:hypothetical protein
MASVGSDLAVQGPQFNQFREKNKLATTKFSPI